MTQEAAVWLRSYEVWGQREMAEGGTGCRNSMLGADPHKDNTGGVARAHHHHPLLLYHWGDSS